MLEDEVQAIYGLGIANIFVVDDNFIGNKKDAKALLTALAEWQEAHGYPIEFMTEVSLNVAQDAELLRLLKLAHFGVIFVAVESAGGESSGDQQDPEYAGRHRDVGPPHPGRRHRGHGGRHDRRIRRRRRVDLRRAAPIH